MLIIAPALMIPPIVDGVLALTAGAITSPLHLRVVNMGMGAASCPSSAALR